VLGAALALIAWNQAAGLLAVRSQRGVEGLGLPLALLVETASSLVLALFFLDGIAALRRGRAPLAGPLFARLFVVLVAAWLALVLGPWEFHPVRVDCAMAAAGAAWALSAWARRRGLRVLPPRAGRILGLVALELALVAVLLEGALRLAAWIQPRPVLAQRDMGLESTLDTWRIAPGTVWWGQPVNSRGHNDDEFTPRSPDRPRIALVGDSFAFCTMPRLFHYSSVLRRRLPGVDVANLGIPGIGPAEYLHLIRTDVAELEPDLVIVTIYVGNDIQPSYSAARPRWLALAFDPENALLRLVPERLWKLRTELHAREAGELPAAVGTEPGLVFADRADAVARFPWLVHPRQEPPLLYPPYYRDAMAHGLRAACDREGFPLEALREQLLAMRAAARPAELAVAIWPAEFQVEERAFELALQGADPSGFQRDRPQVLLRELCAEAGIPCLDVLPAILELEPWSDGQRHVFMAAETHFNARGCRVVGGELARFAAGLLGLAPPGPETDAEAPEERAALSDSASSTPPGR
jgi:hypothetical protein